MSLAEVLVAAVVLATASSGSLQIWAASAGAAQSTERRTAQLLLLDQAMLEAEAQLRLLASSPFSSCSIGALAIARQLEAQALPAGVSRELQLESRGVWLHLQAGELPIRRRWLDAAANGICSPMPTPALDSGSLPVDAVQPQSSNGIILTQSL